MSWWIDPRRPWYIERPLPWPYLLLAAVVVIGLAIWLL